MISYHTTIYLRVITEESVSYNFFRVIDIMDLIPILRENILHANFCFLKNKLQMWLSLDWNF